MISAFGVDHGSEEISKAGGGLIKTGRSLMRMGSPATMQTAGTKAWNRGRKQGLGRVSSGLRATGSAIKSSPGTAAIGGGVTGLAGYGGYKLFDRD